MPDQPAESRVVARRNLGRLGGTLRSGAAGGVSKRVERGQADVGRLGLGVAVQELSAYAMPLPADGQLTGVEVDVGPGEAEGISCRGPVTRTRAYGPDVGEAGPQHAEPAPTVLNGWAADLLECRSLSATGLAWNVFTQALDGRARQLRRTA
ncbi:hypothetical protein [Verrucosispora sp. WMMC514]|uniref:hypothetical protein n=1 Tax=Verrucosispora sp. WMMC514 TaxID=3015156 RepID=UPI00248C976D|nr:hypothetical protein [Verrucosispora sp. WMMC514]WBB91385.1 hypothetical protein O7597_31245 [Verrucosispora sp. WMMC514]